MIAHNMTFHLLWKLSESPRPMRKKLCKDLEFLDLLIQFIMDNIVLAGLGVADAKLPRAKMILTYSHLVFLLNVIEEDHNAWRMLVTRPDRPQWLPVV